MKPLLRSPEQYQRQGSDFKGYYNEPFGGLTRFRGMKNMTGEDAPLIRTRNKRRMVRQISSCNGIFGREKLGWVSGTALYYNGQNVGTVQDNKKTFVHMGAYTLIFPDKKCLNTSTGQLTDLENRVTSSGTVTFTTCDLEGAAVAHGEAIYVKIAGTGIGQGFKNNDVVTISGSTVTGISDGDYQLYNVSANQVIILATMDRDTATQSAALKLERTVPDMDYVTECENRVWGCSSANHEVYACKLGDPTNWRCYQGLSTDSYSVTIGSEGDFTGAVTHLGYVLFFKNDMIHKLFGNKPGNYQLTSSRVRGVEKGSEKSLCVMNESLYYLSQDGECGYEGALPSGISAAWGNKDYHKGIAGAGFGRMWLSVLDESGNTPVPVMFTYDGTTGLWHVEDNVRAEAFAKTQDALYMLDTAGKLWKLWGKDSGAYDSSAADEGDIEYLIETGDLEMMYLERTHVQKIEARMELESGATASIKVQYDGGNWETVASWTGAVYKMSRAVQIIPRRCDHFRIRIEGKGKMELYNLNYVYRPGTIVWVK